MLLELSLIRAVVRDVYLPARYQDEVSSLSEWQVLTSFPTRLMVGFMKRLFLQYFIRDFNVFSIYLIAGLISVLFGTVWGGWHWALSAINDVPASTGTVMLAVLPIILGLQMLLQAITIDIQNVPTQPFQHARLLVHGRPVRASDFRKRREADRAQHDSKDETLTPLAAPRSRAERAQT
jgi:hypothetical protein